MMMKMSNIITVNESLANYFKNTYGVKRVNVIMNFPPTKELDPEKFIDFKAIFSFEKNYPS